MVGVQNHGRSDEYRLRQPHGLQLMTGVRIQMSERIGKLRKSLDGMPVITMRKDEVARGIGVNSAIEPRVIVQRPDALARAGAKVVSTRARPQTCMHAQSPP